MTECECGMYKNQGICYHTGYVPPTPDGERQRSYENIAQFRSRTRIRSDNEIKTIEHNPTRRDPTQA